MACGKKIPKSSLTRVVAGPDGGVAIDLSGKAHGRGTYVCVGGNCSDEPIRRRSIELALRRETSEEDWQDLSTYLASMGFTK